MTEAIDWTAYDRLEDKFREQVQRDNEKHKGFESVYIKSMKPVSPVDVVLIAQEPSMRWAKNIAKAKEYAEGGFTNFVAGDPLPIAVHWAAQQIFEGRGLRYHLTDICKGAGWVRMAAKIQRARWKEWLPLLQEEIEAVAKRPCVRVGIGYGTSQFLSNNGLPNGPLPVVRPTHVVLHYSPDWNRGEFVDCCLQHPDDYQLFAATFTQSMLQAFGRKLMEHEKYPVTWIEDWVPKIKWNDPHPVRVAFVYKRKFEAIANSIIGKATGDGAPSSASAAL